MTELHPAIALTIGVAAVVLAIIVFWPGSGIWWRVVRGLRATERVRIEDALKHLYDCEYQQHAATLASLSGTLEMSGNRTAELAERLQQLDLVTARGARLELTPDGRSYALRVIRIHRLWERHFSDRTGLDASEWHVEAEHREHTTSPREAERLAAGMGFPRYDPHGDPIPTASGEIIPPRGTPLNELEVGQLAEIVHIEDEPQAVYAQLLALRLFPGMQIRLLEASPGRIRFEAQSEEHVLATVVAANLSVIPLAEEEADDGTFETLSSLELGQSARVVKISLACRGQDRRRLLDLGVVPGTEVYAEMRSPGGDPTAYRVRGALLALRSDQAELVYVERADQGAAA